MEGGFNFLGRSIGIGFGNPGLSGFDIINVEQLLINVEQLSLFLH
jgi:hypothetical protein